MGIFKKLFKRRKKKKKVERVEKVEKKVSPKEFKVLKSQHISERATALTKQNKYVFKVKPKANKIEIKKEIERLYNVDVIGVNIINLPQKPRRLGGIRGYKKGYKKAIITLKHGQKIT